ncbi:geranylgeranylglycerol-phosphate geranylgeranyltransferase [Riemerella columbina]|uniref:geranylgeranylglycerol-phosphate geranylgeranyltransferase n=1 Tax=Riemerella columbina TaxID=103810 RepID=UPI000365C5D3|nr:geranylgeranylglycerol-phosphate geranylgeranyltransferase [Riemerella columbina]
MNKSKRFYFSKKITESPRLYRLSQLMSLMLGAKIFPLVFYTLTLYVSTFFLFNQEESLRKFVFDYKVHGIILCSILSIAAGGLINQFYDRERDQLIRPFRSYLQSFTKQKYILYSYIILNTLSLGMAFMLSPRIFVFFLIYQFFIWFYSHKLSRMLLVNNLVFVSLSLYPFFGLLVYYQHFSWQLFWMAIFLFLMLLIIDILKDYITRNADRLFDYHTIPIVLGYRNTRRILYGLLIANMLSALVIIQNYKTIGFLGYYFGGSIVILGFCLSFLSSYRKISITHIINILRIWIFIGVIVMLFNGVYEKF